MKRIFLSGFILLMAAFLIFFTKSDCIALDYFFGCGFLDAGILATGAGTPSECIIGDFNGDGKTDLAQQNSGNVYVWYGTESGFQSAGMKTTGTGLSSERITGDFNGDGKTDLAQQISGNVYVWYAIESGFQYAGMKATGTGLSSERIIGDFNGDGKTDLAQQSSGNVYVWYGTESGFQSAGMKATVTGSPSEALVGDFNGDGKTDLAQQNSGNVYVWYGTESGFQSAGMKATVTGSPSEALVGDFNGDGKIDLAQQISGNVYVWYATESGFQYAGMKATGTGLSSERIIGDFNGDGKTDLAQQISGNVYVWYAIESGFQSAGVKAAGTGSPSECIIGDFNGDGKTDLAQLNGGNVYVWYAAGVRLGDLVPLNNPVFAEYIKNIFKQLVEPAANQKLPEHFNNFTIQTIDVNSDAGEVNLISHVNYDDGWISTGAKIYSYFKIVKEQGKLTFNSGQNWISVDDLPFLDVFNFFYNPDFWSWFFNSACQPISFDEYISYLAQNVDLSMYNQIYDNPFPEVQSVAVSLQTAFSDSDIQLISSGKVTFTTNDLTVIIKYESGETQIPINPIKVSLNFYVDTNYNIGIKIDDNPYMEGLDPTLDQLINQVVLPRLKNEILYTAICNPYNEMASLLSE